MFFRLTTILLFIVFPILVQGKEMEINDLEESLRPMEKPALLEAKHEYIPWLTGTLLSPSGHVIPYPHFQLKPIFNLQNDSGVYNSHWHSINIQNFLQIKTALEIKVGLSKNIDFRTTPDAIYQQTEGVCSTGFGDLPIGFEFQIYRRSKDSWFPSTRLVIEETFPTGTYQQLNVSKLKTDASGLGSYTTRGQLAFSRLFHLQKHHFLELRGGVDYRYYAPVHVKGFNVYGGGFNTNGKEYPGNLLTLNMGIQYCLTQRWVFAMDARYEHRNKNRFKGNPGVSSTGAQAIMTAPSSDKFILAPAIEYNWNAKLGIIGGPWFTIAGRNTNQFYGAIVFLSYYH